MNAFWIIFSVIYVVVCVIAIRKQIPRESQDIIDARKRYGKSR